MKTEYFEEFKKGFAPAVIAKRYNTTPEGVVKIVMGDKATEDYWGDLEKLYAQQISDDKPKYPRCPNEINRRYHKMNIPLKILLDNFNLTTAELEKIVGVKNVKSKESQRQSRPAHTLPNSPKIIKWQE